MAGKWTEKIVSQDLGKEEQLWHPLSWAGRKGRGAIDSVMLMDELRKKTGGTVYGKDIKSAFNSVERTKVAEILADTLDLAAWFLEPRTFDIKIDGRIIGSTRMTGGTPQGSPLSPALLHVTYNHRDAAEDGHTRHTENKEDTKPLHSSKLRDKRTLDKCLQEAAENWGMEWDKDKEWKDGIHLGINLHKRKHQEYRTQKTRAAWGMIRRLTRLPPKEKAKVVVGQLLPMLLYGHNTPWEEGARLVARWVVGA